MKVQIDCYGFEAASEHFQKRKRHTFLVKETDGVVNFVGTDTEESERNHVARRRQALIDMPK